MTPQEKAKELVDEMYNVDFYYDYDLPSMQYEHAKQCALIAVDEILNNDGFTRFDIYLTEYWQEVKHEIEKL